MRRAALLAPVVLLLAACGGGETSDSGAVSPSPSPTEQVVELGEQDTYACSSFVVDQGDVADYLANAALGRVAANADEISGSLQALTYGNLADMQRQGLESDELDRALGEVTATADQLGTPNPTLEQAQAALEALTAAGQLCDDGGVTVDWLQR